MNTMLIIALAVAAAALCAVLGYLFARHRTESRNHHHSEEQHRLRTDLRLAEEQRDQARAQANELRTERDEAQRAQRDRESAWSELTKLRTERSELEKRQAEVTAAQKELEQVREEHSRLQTEQVEATMTKVLATSQEKPTAPADNAPQGETRTWILSRSLIAVCVAGAPT